eukprot:187779-Chlamydomonas_euryale.AAC.3
MPPTCGRPCAPCRPPVGAHALHAAYLRAPMSSMPAMSATAPSPVHQRASEVPQNAATAHARQLRLMLLRRHLHRCHVRTAAASRRGAPAPGGSAGNSGGGGGVPRVTSYRLLFTSTAAAILLRRRTPQPYNPISSRRITRLSHAPQSKVGAVGRRQRSRGRASPFVAAIHGHHA